MTQLIEALSYPFVQRAIAAGVMISLCAFLQTAWALARRSLHWL